MFLLNLHSKIIIIIQVGGMKFFLPIEMLKWAVVGMKRLSTPELPHRQDQWSIILIIYKVFNLTIIKIVPSFIISQHVNNPPTFETSFSCICLLDKKIKCFWKRFMAQIFI